MKGKLIIILMSLMTFATSRAQDDNVLSCPDDNHPHAIDLGLPSGTKWACCNVGADIPEGSGGYYSWGETSEKPIYSPETYLYVNDGYFYDFLGIDIAGSTYDVAHKKWGSPWMMPSAAQSEELVNVCTYLWTSLNGVIGGKFTGPNGNSIFLPAAGYHCDYNFIDYGEVGIYWSSTQVGYTYATSFQFWKAYPDIYQYYDRYLGRNIRPVAVALPVLDDYRTMVKDGKVWKVGFYGSGNPVQHVEYFYFDGDTIIDGKACKQMMCQQYRNLDASDDAYSSQLPSLSYVGAWYEEDKKVYTYDTTNKQFILMYDFSVGANDTLLINQDDYYLIGPRQTGGLKGFKGVYRDVWWLAEEGPIYSPSWLEGVGSIDGPTINVYSGYVDPLRFLMSCTVDDEVIYFNDEYEDGATPEEMNANKQRFDFTHTIKTKPKAPRMGGEERTKGVESTDLQSLYGEYSQQQLSIHLDPLDETYVICITNESNEIVYEKTVNTVDIVGLNIDISTYAKGRYTATVENSNESFVGEFEVQTTGIETIRNKKEDVKTYIYNLQGQRIRSLQKGLNIVNGQKIYVK